MKYFWIVLLGCTIIIAAQENQDQLYTRLSKLPLKCIHQELPNKPSNVIESTEDVSMPSIQHPSFYGCFDWHSSVHGHWSLVHLSNLNSEIRDTAKIPLNISFQKDKIEGEIAYFSKSYNYSFERTYGWAWLLKLQLELNNSSLQEEKEWGNNLQTLSNIIIERYIQFLPKLLYPIRVGTHSNTAFGLCFAYDYAKANQNTELQKSIETATKRLFLNDKKCPINWEPSGTDFLSPCLEEVDLMRRVLNDKEFHSWAKSFLPSLYKKSFQLPVAQVSDRTDGHLVHLDGLNFSRAWVFYGLAKQYPKSFGHLKKLADQHLNHSLPVLSDGNYEGEHWLASFALYALSEKDSSN